MLPTLETGHHKRKARNSKQQRS